VRVEEQKVFLPERSSLSIYFYSISYGFLSTWYQSMATNKDRIEKLEFEMKELKEVMQKMNTE